MNDNPIPACENVAVEPIRALIVTHQGIMGSKQTVYPIDKPFLLHVDISGIYALPIETKCRECGGGGGRRYFYFQDEVKFVRCPTCGNGDKDEWEQEKKNWDAHMKAG